MKLVLVAALVAAAVSLKVPLEDAARHFAVVNPGEEIEFTFGSSGQLAAQIEQGAPVDLFVSAAPADIERLVVARKIELASCAIVAGNRLVVVIPKGAQAPKDLAALAAPAFARIAIGNPKTVPAGRYAKEVLVASKLDAVLDKRLVFAENARQIVDVVARGDADAGLVYATEVALGGAAIERAFAIPENLHTPIVYEGAVVAGSASAVRARLYLKYLSSAAGRDVFVKHGFLPPRTSALK